MLGSNIYPEKIYWHIGKKIEKNIKKNIGNKNP
jgi:hypothetical protein